MIGFRRTKKYLRRFIIIELAGIRQTWSQTSYWLGHLASHIISDWGLYLGIWMFWLPWDVPNPVRRTTARHPPSGVFNLPPFSPVCCNTFVPLNKTCCLSRVILSLASGSSPPPFFPFTGLSIGLLMGIFHWGVLSPVKTASSTIHVPARRRTSAGTTWSSEAAPEFIQNFSHSACFVTSWVFWTMLQFLSLPTSLYQNSTYFVWKPILWNE